MAGCARIVVAVAKRGTVVAFGLLCCPRVSTVSTVQGIPLLASPVVRASQKGSTIVVAIVVAFSLDFLVMALLEFGR